MMTTTRKIRKVLKAKPTMEGAGVHLKRVFGFSEVPMFDPFLLLDDFRNDQPEHYLKGSPGTRTGGSRPSLTCSPATSSTATAWAMRDIPPATSSG